MKRFLAKQADKLLTIVGKTIIKTDSIVVHRPKAPQEWKK